MTTVSTKSGRIIKVVSREEEKSTLTESDNEMDERAVEAVKAAINKAKICKKPIAGYDEKRNKLTLNMQMGKSGGIRKVSYTELTAQPLSVPIMTMNTG